jgi:hypothetical protein
MENTMVIRVNMIGEEDKRMEEVKHPREQLE